MEFWLLKQSFSGFYLLDHFWLQLLSPKIRPGSCQQCSKEQGIESGLFFFFFYCLSFALLCSMSGNFHSASVVKWASNSGHLAFTFEFFITQVWFIVLDLHPPQPFLFSRILFVSYSLFWKSFHCNFLYNVCNSESHFAIILVEKFHLYGKLQVLGACVTW